METRGPRTAFRGRFRSGPSSPLRVQKRGRNTLKKEKEKEKEAKRP